MKKALGILAVITGAAAVVAYKLKKDEQKKETFEFMNEEDISDRILKSAEEQNFKEEEFVEKASTETASYPHLSEEDMIRINELSETHFEEIEKEEDARVERPLQHTIHFDNETDLEKYKNIVINEGYVITSGDTTNDLVVLNISNVAFDNILSKVFYLANLAKEYNGTYVDWILK